MYRIYGRDRGLQAPFLWLKRLFTGDQSHACGAPVHAQVQTVSGCNGRCVFCPNGRTDRKIPVGEKMDMDLYRSIVDQCVDLGVKRFSPYLMNEPLMDPALPERVRYFTDRRVAGQFCKINTNGALLTEKMAKGLLDAGLDRINFSIQGLEPETYERLTGLPLQKVLDNVDWFLELRNSGRYKGTRVRVVMLVTDDLEPRIPAIREYWEPRGVRINLNRIENRGNHKALSNETVADKAASPYRWCQRLFNQVYILHDGRMVMCCADWEQGTVLGDCSRESIEKIWRGEAYNALRSRFLSGNLAGMLCEYCRKDQDEPVHGK